MHYYLKKEGLLKLLFSKLECLYQTANFTQKFKIKINYLGIIQTGIGFIL